MEISNIMAFFSSTLNKAQKGNKKTLQSVTQITSIQSSEVINPNGKYWYPL